MGFGGSGITVTTLRGRDGANVTRRIVVIMVVRVEGVQDLAGDDDGRPRREHIDTTIGGAVRLVGFLEEH